MDGGKKRASACGPDLLLAIPLLWWLALALPVRAQDQTISQMVHTSWTGKDGAPQGIISLAQTPDGILWIGTFAGLFTFDGLKFEAFSPKSMSSAALGGTIQFLFAAKTGELWVFPLHGPPARIRHGEVRAFDHVQGEDLVTLGHPQQESNGTLWAALNERHLVRMESDGIWHQMPDPATPSGNISGLFVDSTDTVWVVENQLMYRKSKGEAEFTETAFHVYGPTKLVEGRDHTLWVRGEGPGPARVASLQHLDQAGRKLNAPRVDGQINGILLASDGSLWISKYEGLQRFRADAIDPHLEFPPNSSDLYARTNVSKDFDSQALLNDFDGNIWVGGTGGLDRFEHANLMPAIPDSKIGMWHSCVDKKGDVWIANANGSVQLFSPKSDRANVIQSGYDASNLFCGQSGKLYLLGDHGISVVLNGRIQQLPLLPGLSGYGDAYRFLGLVEEPNGDLLASVGWAAAGHGLWKYSAEKWSPFLPDMNLPQVCGMLQDAQGRLYLAFTKSYDTVGRIKMGSLSILPGMGAMEFAQTSYGIFAYGRRGIAVDRENSFQKFSFLHSEQADIVTGVVESRNGDLWINAARGIIRIPAVEVRAAMADPAHRVAAVNIQEGDFVGPDIPLFFRNSAHIDPNGQLWFSMLNGVVSVDPVHLTSPRHPPILSIRSLTADGHEMPANAKFPADTNALEVEYFGVDLTDPRSVVYRYRLKSLDSNLQDSQWQDVGSRTHATYTHLRPGKYAFQVMASNGNDIWTPPVSSLPFTILPHFYERLWFQGMLVLIVAAFVWAVLSLRVKSVSRAIKIRAEERADERIRIARELHDTLLQGVQGLLLAFHVASEKVPADHESKKALERALSTADRIIIEGRNRVNRLRSEPLTDSELKASIEGVASELNGDTAVEFVIERKGGNDTLQAHVVDEIFCIAREALTNAFRHSEPSRIAVELDYHKRQFRFACIDNGRGFDSRTFDTDGSSGHFGLRGMSERAEKIGAKFSCTSSPGKGTDVQLIVPARRAYARTNGFRLFSPRRA